MDCTGTINYLLVLGRHAAAEVYAFRTLSVLPFRRAARHLERQFLFNCLTTIFMFAKVSGLDC